jgi:hypothetical protein
MIEFKTTLWHAFFIGIPFSVFAVGSFLWKPRLWLHSLPPDIVKKAAPKTETEKKWTNYVMLPSVLLILPGLSACSVIYLAVGSHADFSFVGVLIHLYSIWAFIHLWDLLIIDGGAILIINPAHPPIPGTEGAKGWSDFNFHFRAFLKALLMTWLFVLPAAAILAWIL